VARDAVFGLVGWVEGAVLAAQCQPQALLGQGILCVQASRLASLPQPSKPAWGAQRIQQALLGTVCQKRPICWLTLLGQGILCVQASRLASLPPAHQSGPSRKAECHSLTKNGNVKNLTSTHKNYFKNIFSHIRSVVSLEPTPATCQARP
jgi:hypothetical protein